MRSFKGPSSVILGLIAVLLIGTAFLKTKSSPEEVNAKECKKHVDSVFDRIAITSALLRSESVLSCTNEMNGNLRNGLPNFASHSSKDMQNYWEMKSAEDMVVRRERFNTELNGIASSCADFAFTIYTSMYSKKIDGETKEAQLSRLQARAEATVPSTILEVIQINLAYKALDDIYSKTGPATNEDAAKRIAVFHRQCKQMYEQALRYGNWTFGRHS